MRYISRYFDTVYMENQLWKTIVQGFAEVKGNLIRASFNDQPIDKIVITGFLSRTNDHTITSYTIVDQVWMIMEEILEQNSYRLTKSGIIFGDEKNH